MDTESVLSFFRDDDILSLLSEDDRYEIALECISHSDFLYTGLEKLIRKYEKE